MPLAAAAKGAPADHGPRTGAAGRRASPDPNPGMTRNPE